MTVGIVGLGLIGGSFARAYSIDGHTVLARDIDTSMLSFAKLCGAVSGDLTSENVGECDLILICVYPGAAVEFMKEMAPYFGKKPVVIDCCGVKRAVFESGKALSEQYGFTYIGGHPMAGTQYSGFSRSRADLFVGAPMVLVPVKNDNITLLDRAKELLSPAGFGSISVTTADKHDELIAFTSQLAHVVSSAYIKSPTALSHNGFSAGSYRDMTRVAWLNPQMWAELVLDNSDYLVKELDTVIGELTKYRDCISSGDRERLTQLLDEGRARKEEVDGK